MINISAKIVIALVLSVSLVMGAMVTGGCASQEAQAPAQPTPPQANEAKTPGQATPAQIIEDISPRDALTLIQENRNNPDFAIIDVRTPEEFAESHIENAINIDFYSETFRDDINRLDKNKTYLIYCRSGRRSASALGIMAELGFKEAYNLLGGIIDWKAAGLPFTK